MRYSDNVNKDAYHFLASMHLKYRVPVKLRELHPDIPEDDPDGDLLVVSPESQKWWDAIVYLHHRDKALTELVKILELDEEDDFAHFPAEDGKPEEWFILGMPADEEDFDFIKEVLFHEGEPRNR